MIYYTGIGSRKTPLDICDLMTQIARELARRGLILRSGGAVGADQAFEAGAGELKRIYRSGDASPAAHEIAERFHPAWYMCSPYARSLHARNVHQILGDEVENPELSEGVVCWTPDGSLDGSTRTSGGTGQALRIAVAYGVHVTNLARPDHREMAECWLRESSMVSL